MIAHRIGVVQDVGRKYGSGDWALERIVGNLAVSPELGAAPPAGEQRKLVRVCIGIGLLGSPTDVVAPGAASAQAGDMITQPQLSWMIVACCNIVLGSFEVESCDIDIKSRRKLSQDSRLMAIMKIDNRAGADVPDTDPTNGTTIKFNASMRTLVRQKGSRL